MTEPGCGGDQGRIHQAEAGCGEWPGGGGVHQTSVFCPERRL